MSETEMELPSLKRELAQVKVERDFLKKASAYFAKEPQQAIRDITEYIEVFYNRQRRQKRLGIYPLLPIGDSLLCEKMRHDDGLVSTIDIGRQFHQCELRLR